MYKKSLEINKRIGQLGVMANDYCNLGGLYKQRGKLGKAREYWNKARDLFNKMGMSKEEKIDS